MLTPQTTKARGPAWEGEPAPFAARVLGILDAELPLLAPVFLAVVGLALVAKGLFNF
jgi:hypothetical protein